MKSLRECFENLNDKVSEIIETIAVLGTTSKSDIRNIQGRLNKNGDIRNEIESVFENLNLLCNEFSNIRNYIYKTSLNNGIMSKLAIIPPQNVETHESNSNSKSKLTFNKDKVTSFSTLSSFGPKKNDLPKNSNSSHNSKNNTPFNQSSNVPNANDYKSSATTKSNNSAALSLHSNSNQNKFMTSTVKSMVNPITSSDNYVKPLSTSNTFTTLPLTNSNPTSPFVKSYKDSKFYAKSNTIDEFKAKIDIENKQKLTSSSILSPISPSSFDISTAEGRAKWKQYIKEKSNVDKDEDISNVTKGGDILKSITKNDENKISDTVTRDVTNHDQRKSKSTKKDDQHVRFKDIVKADPNGKKFRRVFLAQKGWVSIRKFEEQESIYGSDSIINFDQMSF